MNELDPIRTRLGRDDFYLGALLDRLESERERLAGEVGRLHAENRRLIAENERFRAEVTTARLARQEERPATRAARLASGAGRAPGDDGDAPSLEPNAAQFFWRLPASFAFGEFIQTAEAVGLGQRRAKTILLALLGEGTLRLNGTRIEKAPKPATPALTDVGDGAPERPAPSGDEA